MKPFNGLLLNNKTAVQEKEQELQKLNAARVSVLEVLRHHLATPYMPFLARSDALYKSQTAVFVVNCLKALQLTRQEIARCNREHGWHAGATAWAGGAGG